MTSANLLKLREKIFSLKLDKQSLKLFSRMNPKHKMNWEILSSISKNLHQEKALQSTRSQSL